MSGFKARDPDFAERVRRSFAAQAMIETFGQLDELLVVMGERSGQ